MRLRLLASLVVLFVLSICVSDSYAQLTWDPDNDLISDGGDGVWNTSNNNWFNGGSTSWVNGSDAIFGKKADNSTNVVTIENFAFVQVRDITLEAPSGTGAVNFITDTDGGGLTVAAGGGTWELGGRTLRFVNQNDLFDTALFMTSGDTLTVTDSSGGAVFNTGEKPGGATWGVSGATLDIQDGITLRGQADSVGQFANVIMSDGSEFIYERNTPDQNLPNNWVLNGDVSFDNRYNNRRFILGGVVSGSGTLILQDMAIPAGNNSGGMRLGNAGNTFTGGVIVDSTNGRSELNILAVAGDGAFGAVPGVFDPDNITLRNGGELKMTGVTINSNRGITLDGGGIIVLNNTPSEYGGTISGTGGLQIGRTEGGDANTLRLTSDTHTYTGNTRIFKGKLELGIDNAIPVDQILNIGGNSSNARLDMQGFDQEIAGLRTLGGNTRQLFNNTATESVLTINTPADTSHTYVGNIEYSGGTGGIALVKTGDGVQIFSRDSNFASAPTSITVNGGRLRFNDPILDNDPNASPPTALLMPITVNNGGTLVVDAGQATPGDQVEWDEDEIANLLNNGTFNVGSLLGINTGSGDFTYAGNISGNQGLNKIQTNRLTLQGTNTYLGPTIIENGVVMADTFASLPDTGLAVNGTEGPGYIGFNLDSWTETQVDDRINDSNTTFEANAGVELANSAAETYSNDIPSFVTNFAVSGSGSISSDALTLTGTNSYSGTTIIRSGAVIKGSADAVPDGTLMTVGANSGVDARFQMNGFDQTLSGLRSNASAGTVQVANNSATATTLTIDTAGVDSTYNGRLGGSVGIFDANFSLVKNGEGNQVLNGENSYQGTTAVNAGRLVLRQPLDSAALDPGDVTVAAGAEIVLEGGGGVEWSDSQMQTFLADQTLAAGSTFGIRADDEDFTFSGVISGDKNFLRTGNQDDTTVTLTQAQTYTGDTTVARGRLVLSVANTLPVGTVVGIGSPNGGARLVLNGNDQEIGGLISTGSGGGLRRLYNDSATAATLTINVGAGESYEYGHTLGEVNAPGSNFNNFNIVKNGDGTQIIEAANHEGGTTINAGTFLFNGNGSGATGAVTVASGATLGGTGSIGGTVTASSGSSVAPGASAGTLSVLSDFNLNAGAALDFELRGDDFTVGGGVNDLLDLSGDPNVFVSLTLNGSLNVSALASSPADFNNDGAVDGLDLAQWEGDYGVNGDSDANGDGLTTSTDFLIWQRERGVTGDFSGVQDGDRWTLITYGDTNTILTNNLTLGTLPALPGGLQYEIDDTILGQIDLVISNVSISAVPEPSTVLLLSMSCLGLLRRRR